MCDFCNNSGNSISTDFDKETKELPNFSLLIYGDRYLRISSKFTDVSPRLRSLIELRPESLAINFCPICGRNLRGR